MAKAIIQTVRFKNQIAEQLYSMYLNSKEHGLLTGGGKAKISEKAGTAFSAWDGYISGKNLLLVKGKLIVQSWQAADWEDLKVPSVLVLQFDQDGKDALIIMTHTGVPANHIQGITKGWMEYYWKPWRAYLKNSGK
ncbi:MAG: SRPBCC domain-containing protein [Bacteroidetes bacterium]|nr:SRPBCC domain-containing protein [Bacteroidota bacterium]